jgi:putative DNA primase/helicase
MGIAVKYLGESERETIARGLFTVTEHDQSRCELIGICPIHGEKNPSFSYNYRKDAYHCLSCQASGDLVALWGSVRGIEDKGERVRAFKAEFGIEDGKGDGKGPARPRRPDPPTPEDEDLPKKAASDIDAAWERFPPLPDGWLRRLAADGAWSAETMRRLDIRLQTHYRRKSDGELVALKLPERIAIPVRSPAGKLLNIRLYKPGATEMKIISWGKGFGKARLFPPEPLEAEGMVLLCEGEKDTITAISHGFNGITQTSKLKTWPAGHLRPFAGRDVVIAYDADVAGQKYAAFAAQALSAVAGSVRLLEWPEYMGRRPDGQWPEAHGEDLTDFFVKHRKTREDLLQLIAQAKPYTPAETPKIEGSPADVMRFFEIGVGGRVSFKPRLLAEQIIRDEALLSDPATGQLYRWTGRWWEGYAEDHVESRCLHYLGDEAQRARVKDAAYQVRILSTIPHGRAVNDRFEWICLQNGMLNLRTLELRSHERDYYATVALGIDFEPSAGKHQCDRWREYLQTNVQSAEPIMQLQEFAGYCLTRSTAYGKCLLLLGPGSDGKSLFLKILRYLVGPENCSAISFQDLEDQFLRASLYGKLLNISTEVGSKALESQYFKAVVTGDPISAAFKHQDPFEFTPFCKQAFASNKMPRVLDNSEGYFRRLLPVMFKRQFLEDDPATDPDLEEKLREELPGIFEWALVGLHRLWKQGRFTMCRETLDLLTDYRRLNNPVLAFVEDECQLGDEFTAAKDDVYKQFRGYCSTNGYSPLNKENFFRELYAAVSHLRQFRPRVDGRRETYVKGLGLVFLDNPGA